MDRTSAWPGSGGEHQLQERYGTADRAQRFYSQQVLDHLNERMREFVAEQEMMFVATSDGHGECDNTFRAGPPGFVQVLDPDRLAWPEYRGNGVMASLGNISENPHVGLLFMDFTQSVIGLHVNGRAAIVEDADMRTEYDYLEIDDAPGRRPERWVVVEVEEAYIHCAKHIPRMTKVSRDRPWGTDDVRRKGGDFFDASREPRPWGPDPQPGRGLPEQRSPGDAPGTVRRSRRHRASDVARAARLAEVTEAARVAEADWAAEVARVAREAEAARIAEGATKAARPAVGGAGQGTDAEGAPAAVDAGPAGRVEASEVARTVDDLRSRPGRHRRLMRLLRHNLNSGRASDPGRES
ncbi:pyridoxamine 5'-phosphate oxidase family protein [Planosporangium sp. 12N6]|uniref:pyridoxamine 5'-phosphate oxidase family protein n=1 Tax=Planosporangium spinosum TaxID=3402278 RepID=UPI003CEAE56D